MTTAELATLRELIHDASCRRLEREELWFCDADFRPCANPACPRWFHKSRSLQRFCSVTCKKLAHDKTPKGLKSRARRKAHRRGQAVA